jgi:hypothetical protein
MRITLLNSRAVRVLRFTINRISPSRLYVKGPPKFAMQSINHIILIPGKKFRIPLLHMILREWARSYIILAQENIPDEQTPWAIITIIAPLIPHDENDRTPTIISAICTTDE